MAPRASEKLVAAKTGHAMMSKVHRVTLPLAALLALVPASLPAQTATSSASPTQAATPRQSGTIKAVTPRDFVLTTAAGQDFAVNMPASVRVLLVDPATRDVKNAQPGTMADVTAGDKAIVTGTTGDVGQTLNATRVLLLKSGAIAALHAQQEAAWAHSVGGIVKSVDDATGTLTVLNGTHTYTLQTSANTTVRRYTGASVRFEDAVKSSLSAIRQGDQVQARGQRSADGQTVTAEEIVAGSFSNYSGVLTAVDPAAGTVTLKDLATKSVVTVAVTPQTNLRKLPATFGSGQGNGAAAAGGENTSATPAPPRGAAGGSASSTGEGRAAGGNRMDLSRMLNRLPTETSADLKQGDAVLIVASNGEASGQPTAITLLSGVEKILASSPAGQTTLSPWSLGGAEASGGEAGGAGGGR